MINEGLICLGVVLTFNKTVMRLELSMIKSIKLVGWRTFHSVTYVNVEINDVISESNTCIVS